MISRRSHSPYVGDGNNVAHLLLLTAACLGSKFRIATPSGYGPNAEILAAAQQIATETGAVIELFTDPHQAVAHAGLLIAVFVLLGGLIYAGLRIYLEQSLAATQARRAVLIGDALLTNIATTGEAHVVSEINSWFAPATIDRFILCYPRKTGARCISRTGRGRRVRSHPLGRCWR